MAGFFAANWGTIVICIVLIAIITAIILKLRKDKKAGKSISCGDCKHCGGNCAPCHSCSPPLKKNTPLS